MGVDDFSYEDIVCWGVNSLGKLAFHVDGTLLDEG